jgi:hypothetical protein
MGGVAGQGDGGDVGATTGLRLAARRTGRLDASGRLSPLNKKKCANAARVPNADVRWANM